MEQDVFCQWLDDLTEDGWPEVLIRKWSDGEVELIVKQAGMGDIFRLRSESLPGLWSIDSLTLSKVDVSIAFSQDEYSIDDRKLAAWMHEQYEDVAADVGWETQDRTSVAFDELPKDNRKVMLELSNRVNNLMEKRRPNTRIINPNDTDS